MSWYWVGLVILSMCVGAELNSTNYGCMVFAIGAILFGVVVELFNYLDGDLNGDDAADGRVLIHKNRRKKK